MDSLSPSTSRRGDDGEVRSKVLIDIAARFIEAALWLNGLVRIEWLTCRRRHRRSVTNKALQSDHQTSRQ